MESSNLWEFVSSHLGLILAILGLSYALITFFRPRKPYHVLEAHLSKTDLEEAEAAGDRAREDVRTRFGKYFGGGNP